MLLAKTPSELEVVNDLDGDIVAFWRVLRDQPEGLERACALTPHSRLETVLAGDREGVSDLERVRHFRLRVLADALSEATASYWNHRAEQFENAAPRPGDFTGRATAAELAERGRHCRARAQACRQRALLETTATPPIPPIVLAELTGDEATTW